MEFAPRVWKFVADMNYDGSVTISDVWLWVKWLYFYPGDLIILLLTKVSPGLVNVFEHSSHPFSGIFSFGLSLIAWVVLFTIFKLTKDAVESAIEIKRHGREEIDEKVRKFWGKGELKNWENQREEFPGKVEEHKPWSIWGNGNKEEREKITKKKRKRRKRKKRRR